MSIEKCPVCEGIKEVPAGFYNRHPGCGWTSSTLGGEVCRSCGGRGYIAILEPEFDYVVPVTTGGG